LLEAGNWKRAASGFTTMSSTPTRLFTLAVVCCAAGTILMSQAPQAPAPAAAQPAPQGGRGGLDAQIAQGADFLKRPPVVRQTPEAELKNFLLPPGYKLEPVLADPLIEDPVGVSFDGNGRMYVLEMRSYMQDADGSTARQPISRISRHEDTDGDGVYDKHTVFVDKLVMPRIAYPLQDGVLLVLETDNRDMHKYTDTNGDGVADKKELFYPGAGRVTNMEWQPGGLTWALDNWLYMTYNPYRLRIAPDGRLLREETEPNGGQWWSAQDDHGKMWWVDGGGEIGPVNIQTPIAYGAFNVPDNFEPDFQVPYPAPGGIADMQGGMNRVRLPDGTLNHFTAASGVEIYRGDRLPKDMLGDLFFNEPVARIVRRAKIVVTDGLTQLRNAYPKSEFIRSTDPLFRPVCIVNAPDGTLYLMDMYTGIIQDAQFVGAGSYLRRKVEQYDLDKQHNWGRIWRITYEGMEPDRRLPKMYNETPAQLVEHFNHPNGWWRDTAQKLLVLKQDKSVVPALKTMARTSSSPLARTHALWTLEGLASLDAPLAREFMKSPDPQLRIQGIRASETLYKAGDKSFAADYKLLAKDADPNVVIQAMLTMNLQKVPDSAALIQTTASASSARGVKEIGTQILKGGTSLGQRPSLADTGAGGVNLTVEQRRAVLRGEGTYKELCFSCHGADGKGAPMQGAPEGATLAPSLAGSQRVLGHRDYVIKVLLHGLTGDIDGNAYGTAVMVPMGSNTDQWIADVASYVRTSFGNGAPVVTPEQVASVRKTVTRGQPWTMAELLPTVPTPMTNAADWKVTASHNESAAVNVAAAAPAARWDTAAPQSPGMWFQIELPQPTMVTELVIESALPFSFGGGRGGRGAGAGGGRGAAPSADAPARGAGAPAAAPIAPAPPAQAGAAPAAGARAAGGQPAGRGTPAGGGRGGPPAAGPVAYSVQVSMDGQAWGAPVAQGAGQTPITTIAFTPVTAKFIRITQTGSAQNGELWAVAQARVFQVSRVAR
jgi:mono/diheme cytochrome c family protein